MPLDVKPLDPPSWFWNLIHESAGDDARFRELLGDKPRNDLILCHAFFRDLANSVSGEEHTSRMAPGISDTGAFEVGQWVVTQGRDFYRAVVTNPSRIPRTTRPGQKSARMMYGTIGDVYSDRFGEELPTDFPLEWDEQGNFRMA